MVTIDILTVLLAIVIFSALIFIHELGHFLAARKFGVTVEEFSIGMGPKLFSRLSRKSGTRYSLRALPIGGYVSMPGENGASDDPNALCNKSVPERMAVVCAGAIMNFLLGILVMTIIVSTSSALGSTTIHGFEEKASSEATGLMIGDTIIKVGNERVYVANDLVYEIMRAGTSPVDITVKRSGETVLVPNVRFPSYSESGIHYAAADFYVFPEEKSFSSIVKHSFFRSVSTVEMIWESLIDLITGRYGIEAMSGPVGVTEAISETAKSGGISGILYLIVVITMNLGIFNLLPLPALDGGRLMFLIVEAIRKRPIDPELEAKIHAAGIIALLLLMAFVTYQDITKLFV
ncbi:MAG: site-2 protease family protein [Clostridia bacterium]|nr:site-2 protease family protein [Clostridia bacterium]